MEINVIGRGKRERPERTSLMGGYGSHRPSTGFIFSELALVYKHTGGREPLMTSQGQALAPAGYCLTWMRGNGRDLLVIPSGYGCTKARFVLMAVPVEDRGFLLVGVHLVLT
jgi:hypothetical protein